MVAPFNESGKAFDEAYLPWRSRHRDRIEIPARTCGPPAAGRLRAVPGHSGALPLLVRQGFRGRVWATPATIALCELLLPDSGHLQEDDAAFANRHKTSKHDPALPLYTEDDARQALRHLEPLAFDRPLDLGGLQLRLRHAGHILGASSLEIRGGRGTLLFSGDIGRPDDLLMKPPSIIEAGDVLVVESTYGDRTHGDDGSADAFADVIVRTAARGGMVIVPDRAAEARAQDPRPAGLSRQPDGHRHHRHLSAPP